MPSLSELTLMPVTVQVPAEVTVAVWAVVEVVPSLATTETVAPASPVPLAVVLEALLRLIGLVTLVKPNVAERLIVYDGPVKLSSARSRPACCPNRR